MDRAVKADLTSLRIGEVILVGAEPRVRHPERLAQRQHLAVLGETDIVGNRQLGWIMCHQRREILIDKALETFCIAACRCVRNAGQGKCRGADESKCAP